MIYKGIGVSSGLALAKTMILKEFLPQTIEQIESGSIQEEKAKAASSMEKAISQLEVMRNRLESKECTEHAEIIEVQIMMLQDPILLENIHRKIDQNQFNVFSAVQEAIEEQAEIFDNSDDSYFKERAQDVRDIGRRLLNIIIGIEEIDISNLKEDVILVGKNITPSQMASMDRDKVKGIVSEIGGKTSHTAILAKNMDIPAVFGCKGISDELESGLLVALNGTDGTILTEISAEKEILLKNEIDKIANIRKSLKEMIEKPSRTKDGTEASICANIMLPEDVSKVLEVGADGIGLYRTEFLFMNRNSMPNEEEQFRAYKHVIHAMGEKTVIIRTMDIGGDKEVAYMNLPREENPFIGYRAIRICLDDKELFKTQLKAILRASAFGNAMIMYPMISALEEVRMANAILEEAKEELLALGKEFDRNIKTGIMIEVPSAAATADILIKEADFFSIGTNDLTQYTLAVDRMNEKLAYLYNSYQPGVLRLIKNVIDSVNKNPGKKFAGMCGEMASDPFATLLLLGLGLHEFSVNSSSVLKIRKLISLVDMDFAKEVAEKAMVLSTAAEVEKYLSEITTKVMGDYIL